MGATIYTIGHGEQDLDDLFAALRKSSIQLLVDVRTYPASRRNPQFNRSSLTGMALRCGMRYRWEEALGGKPRDRSLWTESGVPDYRQIGESAPFQLALDQLIDEAQTQTVAVLCSETRPEECHRSLLIQPWLVERGINVQHLLPGGRVLGEVAAMKRML